MYLVWQKRGCMWPTIQNEFDIPGIDFQLTLSVSMLQVVFNQGVIALVNWFNVRYSRK